MSTSYSCFKSMFKFDERPFNLMQLTHDELCDLRKLSNDNEVDFDDNGEPVNGSMFKEYIDAELSRRQTYPSQRFEDRLPHDVRNRWAIRAWHVDSARAPVAWTMFRFVNFPPSERGKTVDFGFYVNPAFRRRGLASSLFKKTLPIVHSDPFNSKQATFSPWNRRAKALFESFGAEQYHFDPELYVIKDLTDAMRRLLREKR